MHRGKAQLLHLESHGGVPMCCHLTTSQYFLLQNILMTSYEEEKEKKRRKLKTKATNPTHRHYSIPALKTQQHISAIFLFFNEHKTGYQKISISVMALLKQSYSDSNTSCIINSTGILKKVVLNKRGLQYHTFAL